MSKDEFKQLFETALEKAATNADQRLSRNLSRNFEILLHGAGRSGVLVSPAETVDALYLGESLFYRIIDVSVVKVSRQATTVFMRASGHTPAPLEQTWNDPPGTGPFKQLISKEIQIVD